MTDLSRFLSKVSVSASGCHEWQSTLHRDGYGKFWFGGKQIAAHRVAYLLQIGEIPNGMWVLHRCDNRKCVNPEHLYIGDAKQNVRDKVDRCKWWGNMKVPFDVVEKCRTMYAEGKTQQYIADELGVHQAQVSRYVRFNQRLNK